MFVESCLGTLLVVLWGCRTSPLSGDHVGVKFYHSESASKVDASALKIRRDVHIKITPFTGMLV